MTEIEKSSVLALREEGRTLQEIALELNLPINTVKSFIYRTSLAEGEMPGTGPASVPPAADCVYTSCLYCGKAVEQLPTHKEKKFCSDECRTNWWNENKDQSQGAAIEKVPYNFKDLRGQRIGRLTIVKRGPDRIQPSGQKKTRWWCDCVCGNTVLIAASDMLNGNTQSCGCIHKEATSRAKKKYNHYKFKDGVVIGYTRDEHEFCFDEDDFDLVPPYCWNSNHNGYIWSIKGKHNIALHRLIMQNELGENLYVDHINHDPSDNRKCNLRVVTHLDNMHNHKRNVNNTSGVTAFISINGQGDGTRRL